MKIVLLESLAIPDTLLDSYANILRAEGHEFCAYPKDTNEDTQIACAKDADVIMLANMPLSAKVIASCPNLKFIDVAFTGVDHVALDAAKARNIAVSNASGYANVSVAELTLCMMLSLLRNVPQVDARCRNGQTKEGLVGRELKGKTVGIVGTGAIGIEVAKLCHAFGCEIIGYDGFPKKDAPDYITYTSLEELLERSDIVTLHCPLNDSSLNLINKERIGLMKSRSYLINAARGPVVDSQALADALNNEQIAGAGIDVFEVEPPLDTAHPLLSAKNIIVTPHIAFASDESMKLRADIVFDNLHSWIKGKQINTII
jgi:Lactate dehydrogenase and related dehydrogenases